MTALGPSPGNSRTVSETHASLIRTRLLPRPLKLNAQPKPNTIDLARIVDELIPQAGDIHADKYRMSGFWDTPVDAMTVWRQPILASAVRHLC